MDWQEDELFSNGSFTEHITGFSADGVNHLGVNAMPPGYGVFQDTGVAWAPNTRYTLTVAVGNRNQSFTLPGNQSTIQLAWSGGSLIEAAFDASVLPVSTFSDLSIIYTTGSSVPMGTVIVRLSNEGPGRSHFDNVRLDAVRVADAIPEPSRALFGLVGMTGLAAGHRRRPARK